MKLYGKGGNFSKQSQGVSTSALIRSGWAVTTSWQSAPPESFPQAPHPPVENLEKVGDQLGDAGRREVGLRGHCDRVRAKRPVGRRAELTVELRDDLAPEVAVEARNPWTKTTGRPLPDSR